jgi:hypothetical protein
VSRVGSLLDRTETTSIVGCASRHACEGDTRQRHDARPCSKSALHLSRSASHRWRTIEPHAPGA